LPHQSSIYDLELVLRGLRFSPEIHKLHSKDHCAPNGSADPTNPTALVRKTVARAAKHLPFASPTWKKERSNEQT